MTIPAYLPKIGSRYKELQTGKILIVDKVTQTTIFLKDENGRLSALAIDQFHMGSGLVRIFE